MNQIPQEHEQQEDLIEDDPEQYTGSIATALADQRISRKKASEDVKILANRIALLKAEEDKVSCILFVFTILKAWKKIEETKKKAQDILEVRQRNNVNNTGKAMNAQQKAQQLADLTAKNNDLK